MRYHISSRLKATLNLCLSYFKIPWVLAILLEHILKNFEINWTKIKGSCQSGIKVVTHNSKSDLPPWLSKDRHEIQKFQKYQEFSEKKYLRGWVGSFSFKFRKFFEVPWHIYLFFTFSSALYISFKTTYYSTPKCAKKNLKEISHKFKGSDKKF